MNQGAGRAGKMSQEYGPRGILLLLELGPIVSSVLTSASAADAHFGKSTGNGFWDVQCIPGPCSKQGLTQGNSRLDFAYLGRARTWPP